MSSSRAREIREAVRAAQAASATRPDDPFKQVLDDVALGLTDEAVEARLTSGPGGRWTLWLAPAHRPGRAVAMLSVVISARGADVLLNPKQVATTPEQLADILRTHVTTPAFLESLQEISELAAQPVEGFLRMAPRTVSREDLMLEVPPEVQREIAQSVDKDVSIRLRIADFPGAGTFMAGTRYKVLESAGFSVTLSKEVAQAEDGSLQIVGRVTLADVPRR